MLQVMLMDFTLAYKFDHNLVQGVLISTKFVVRET